MVIPAGGQVARFIDELFPTLPIGFEGMLKVSSTIPLGAASLRVRYNQRSGMIVTSVPVSDDSNRTSRSGFLFPLIVTGSGYSTDFVGVKR